MMEIISHRGFWKHPDEKNKHISFQRSFYNKYGTETDLRDCDGVIVISHNMPLKSDKNLTIDDFFQLYKSYDIDSTLALNIKSDGLQEILKEKLLQYNIQNYFVFDMSIPDTRGCIRNNLNFFVRQSEIENSIIFEDQNSGIWLDAFDGLWYDEKYLTRLTEKNKKIALVSFELHRRDHIPFWQWLKEHNLHTNKNLILCTDIPDQAQKFFFNNTIIR